MAGMLPGVESARWRRFRQSGESSDCPYYTRRSSLCLYASKHESLLPSSSSSSPQQLSELYQARTDEKLAGVAGEAKVRLDERFRSAQINSSNKRSNKKADGREGDVA